MARDGTDVIRLGTSTGRRLGQGLVAPPMALVNFGLAGPEFLLTRTVGGITGPDGSNVKSGLNCYRTDAP